ncbi:radical SAM protein [Candidatus Kuenenbacteria bacterium]|nr:radical SAM protein [Candidatus Kuenenbacteria bacterium]
MKLGLNKLDPSLRCWVVTNMEFNKHHWGTLVPYDTILYFMGERWSLIRVISDLFRGVLHEGKTPASFIGKPYGQEDLSALGQFLWRPIEGTELCAETIFLTLQTVAKVIEKKTGVRPYELVPIEQHQVRQRNGYLVPYAKKFLMELGKPIHRNGGACGNNCGHCYLDNQRKRFLNQFPHIDQEKFLMTKELCLEVVRWVADWSVPEFVLSGAPFADWETTLAIAELLAHEGAETHIHCEVSNFLPWQAEELARIMAGNLPTIEFSLEGSTAENNGTLRRSLVDNDTTFFDRILAAMKCFAELGFPISVGTTLHTKNLDDLWSIYQLLQKTLGDAFVEWSFYPPEWAGRMRENPGLFPSPEQTFAASKQFIKKWLEKGDHKRPLVATPMFGYLNREGKLIDPREIFAKGQLDDLTAYPRDRRDFRLTTYWGVKIDSMSYTPEPQHYLWSLDHGWPDDLGARMMEIWQSPSYQRFKNIPVAWMSHCPDCPVRDWCRGGFQCKTMGDEHWDGEMTELLTPNSYVCEVAGVNNNGLVDAHNIQEILELF